MTRARLGMTVAASPRVRVARVRRAHGLRGELRVEPLGGAAGRFAPPLVLYREDGGARLTVSGARAANDGDVLIATEELTDRAAADAWRDAYLCVDASLRRSLGDDEWFVADLVGLRVRTPEGVALGVVGDVEAYAAHEVLVVRTEGGVEVRYPMARAFVRAVDLERGEVVVTPWPEDA